MNTDRPPIEQRRRFHGQSMLEFALILPVMLLVLFGLVEFGRIFQAWLTIENAARTAARYAASGQYNPAYCAEVASLLDSVDPHPNGITYAQMDGNGDCRVTADAPGVEIHNADSHWYFQEVEGRLQDAARSFSIRDVAYGACNSISVDEAVSGDITRDNDFFIHRDGDRTQRGYFHVTLCSTRRPFVFDRNGVYSVTQQLGARYTCVFDPDQLRNTRDERLQDDSGGPNDRVAIAIMFNHPLITPIRGIADNAGNYVTLYSVREMIVERFRTARVIGLPPAFEIPPPPPPPQVPPIVRIVRPDTAGCVDHTNLILQARACDPDDSGGTCDPNLANGSGITSVRLWLRDPLGRNVSDWTDSRPEYCGRGGDSNPCPGTDLSDGVWPWQPDLYVLPGRYTLFAIATDNDGEQWTAMQEFDICITVDCTRYTISNFRYTNAGEAVVAVDVRNNAFDSPEVEGVRVAWPKSCLEPNVVADRISLGGANLWGNPVDGGAPNDSVPPTDAMVEGLDRTSFVAGVTLPSGSTRVLEMDLDGNTAYYATRFPGGPYFQFDLLLSNGCLLTYAPQLTPTPEPDCTGLTAGPLYYTNQVDEIGVVISNTTSRQDFEAVGFEFNWPEAAGARYPGLRTDDTRWNETAWAASFDGTAIWNGDDTAPPSWAAHPCYEYLVGAPEPAWQGRVTGPLPRGDVDTWMIEFDATGLDRPNMKSVWFPGQYAARIYLANPWGGVCAVNAIQPPVPLVSCEDLTANPLYLSTDDARAVLRNTGQGWFDLLRTGLVWATPAPQTFPGMYLRHIRMVESNTTLVTNPAGGSQSPVMVTFATPVPVPNAWQQTFEYDFNYDGSVPGYDASNVPLAANYLHGRQFGITMGYRMASGTPCPDLTIEGKYGPVIRVETPGRRGGDYEVYPNYSPINSESSHATGNCINGVFTIRATAFDYDYGAGAANGAGINSVQFQVVAPDGRIVNLAGAGAWKTENSVPYCAFGDNGSVCYTRDTLNNCHTWDATNCQGTDYFMPGVHTLRVVAVDNDTPGDRLRTLFVTRFEICTTYQATATPTPTPTTPPTAVPTPTRTPTPTPTRTPTPDAIAHADAVEHADAHADAIHHTDADAHTDAVHHTDAIHHADAVEHADAYADPYPYADTHAGHADADEYADAHTHPHAHQHTHAHADADTHARLADADAYPDAHADAYADSYPDAGVRRW